MQKLGHDYKALLEEKISDNSKKKKGLVKLEATNDQIKVFVKGKDKLFYKQNFDNNNKKKSELD